MRKILLLLILSTFAAAQTSFAQVQRQLPANGKRGVTGEQQPMPSVVINRQVAKLAPGGIIFDAHNRTILQQHLPANVDVLYQVDMRGDIQRIYILTPDERARLAQAKK